MRGIDQEATVVRLACLTEDRSPDEQRALLEVALRIDKKRASRAITNRDVIRPCLFTEVLDTYEADTGQPAPRSLVEKHRRLVDRYDTAELEHAQHEDHLDEIRQKRSTGP